MLRVLIVVTSALLVIPLATGQVPIKEYKGGESRQNTPRTEPAERGTWQDGLGSSSSKYKPYEPLTNREKAVLTRALMGDASVSDVQMATDICTKKCKECINGAECNLECAKKACFK